MKPLVIQLKAIIGKEKIKSAVSGIYLVEFIKKYDGIKYATSKMNEFRDQAFQILDSLDTNISQKNQLNLLVNFVIDRNV